MSKPCHYAVVEAVDPFKVHPTPMSYKNEVFEAYQHLRIGIWLHKHMLLPQMLLNILEN